MAPTAAHLTSNQATLTVPRVAFPGIRTFPDQIDRSDGARVTAETDSKRADLRAKTVDALPVARRSPPACVRARRLLTRLPPVRSLMTLGMYSGGCLMVAGLLSTCSIIGIAIGVHLIWIGFIVLVLFAVARALL